MDQKIRTLYLSLFLFTLAISPYVLAINTIATGFKVLNSTTLEIDAHGTCARITNSSGSDHLVATKTAAEWSSFRSGLPSGLTTAACSAPACGGTLVGGYCWYLGAPDVAIQSAPVTEGITLQPKTLPARGDQVLIAYS